MEVFIKYFPAVVGSFDFLSEICKRAIHIGRAIEKRCLQLSLIKILPIYVLEPKMVFQESKTRPTKPGFWLIFIQQLVHQLSRFLVFERVRIF